MMQTQTAGPTELYRQAQLQIQNGQLDPARQTLLAFVKMRPDVGRIWHQLGILCQDLNEPDQAAAHFQKALEFLDAPEQTLTDLTAAYLRIGKTEAAVRNLRILGVQGSSNRPLLEEAVRRLEQQGDTAGAMELLIEANPSTQMDDGLMEQLDRLRAKRAKIAFFCGGDGATFLKDIAEHLGQRHAIRFFEGTSEQDVYELMQWSDISWFEWCTNLARIGSRLPKVCKNIVRLHRYEAYLSWPKEIQWEHIDRLVLVGNTTVLKALDHWGANVRNRVRIVTIPNGVKLEKIVFHKRPRGKNIAFVAAMRMVKNPMFLLQCMAALHRIDPEYHLYIAGNMQDLLVEHYFEHQVRQLGLEEVVHFDGWQQDIPQWLSDKHYLAVTSVIESQGMGALEAMAAGLKPVIHHFPGANEIFDRGFLFNTPHEFCEQILSEEYDSFRYREFVEQRYPLDRTCRLVNEVITDLEEDLAAPAEFSAGQTQFQAVRSVL